MGLFNRTPDPELDAHLATRLPQLAADAAAARAAGNKRSEEAITRVINTTLDKTAERKGWRRS